MPGEFYFMALAGLGMSLAGFAGLIATLGNRQAGWEVVGWRIQNIVVGGLIITFSGFGVVAIYGVTEGDLALTLRLSSLLIASAHAAHVWFAVRPASPWVRGSRLSAIIPGGIVVLALLANGVVADLGLLQILMLAMVVAPASIFVTTIRDVARKKPADSDSSGP